MEILKYKNFRVSTILKFVKMDEETQKPQVEDIAIADGLAIEHTTTGDSYCVIAFVRIDKDGGVSYDSVGSRIEEFCPDWESVKVFRMCLGIAKKEITDAFRAKKKSEAEEAYSAEDSESSEPLDDPEDPKNTSPEGTENLGEDAR